MTRAKERLEHDLDISQCPLGHAIEAGWFLLQYARKIGDTKLKKIAIDEFIIRMFEHGWDTKYGGLFYFLDADGYR